MGKLGGGEKRYAFLRRRVCVITTHPHFVFVLRVQPQWLEYEVYCLGASRFNPRGARVQRKCAHLLSTRWRIREACGLLGGVLMNSKMVILTSSMPLWSPLEKCCGIGLSWWLLVMPPKCPTKRSLRHSRVCQKKRIHHLPI